MLVAVFCRSIADIKVLRRNRAACSWKKSCFGTDTQFFHTGRHFKIFVFQTLMDPRHYLPPHILVEVAGIIVRKLFVVVIA